MSPSLRIFVFVLAGWFAVGTIPATIVAQDSSHKQELLDLFKQWRELDQELATKQQDFQSTADADKKEDLRGQYESLLNQSKELVEKNSRPSQRDVGQWLAGCPNLPFVDRRHHERHIVQSP